MTKQTYYMLVEIERTSDQDATPQELLEKGTVLEIIRLDDNSDAEDFLNDTLDYQKASEMSRKLKDSFFGTAVDEVFQIYEDERVYTTGDPLDQEKLPIERVADFKDLLLNYIKTNPGQRFGQYLFNVLSLMRPLLADMIRGTEADPFYTDSKIKNFLKEAFDFDVEPSYFYNNKLTKHG